MIYDAPEPGDPLDQGDLIDDCPLVEIAAFDPADSASLEFRHAPARVVALTQACDLAGRKTQRAVVAPVYEAHALVQEQKLKPADIRGPIRAGRVFGWYFLPSSATVGTPESIVDLRQLHSVPVNVLVELCRTGRRRARIQPLYREHLAKHLADTYSRIGLPQPYQTEM